MKIFLTCMECQKGLGHPSFEPIFADYYDSGVANVTCSRGHTSAVMVQNQKFEILLESAANALLDGYTIEAASSLSAAYERFFEFTINVFCKNNSITEQALDETFKQVAKQSERQIGGFLFLYLITFGSGYQLNKKIPEQRNKIIHQGYIPTPEEVMIFGDLIYQEICSITQLLKSKMQGEMTQVVMDELLSKSEKIPAGTPRSTIGTTSFSFAMGEPKKDFQEALDAYKKARELISGSVPYLKLLHNTVSLFAKK